MNFSPFNNFLTLLSVHLHWKAVWCRSCNRSFLAYMLLPSMEGRVLNLIRTILLESSKSYPRLCTYTLILFKKKLLSPPCRPLINLVYCALYALLKHVFTLVKHVFTLVKNVFALVKVFYISRLWPQTKWPLDFLHCKSVLCYLRESLNFNHC